MKKLDRKLILEDGSEYYGYGFGSGNERITEIVFNTSPVTMATASFGIS